MFHCDDGASNFKGEVKTPFKMHPFEASVKIIRALGLSIHDGHPIT